MNCVVLKKKFAAPLMLRAYNLGRIDAILGDDMSSVDYQTNEIILNKIKTKT